MAARRGRRRDDVITMGWKLVSDRAARRMYSTRRGDATARVLSRLWGWAFAFGLMPRRWVRLEVLGRRSGEVRSFPLGMADVDGRWYLVSMLGDCAWVRNVRAAEGRVVLRRRRRYPCTLEEVPVDERGPILRRYVERVPGGRPHIPVEPGADVDRFREVAADYPVFVVRPDEGSGFV